MKKPTKRISNKKGLARHAYRKGFKLSRHDVEEFGSGKTDIMFCSEGDTVYYYKSWHHNLRRYRYLSENKAVRFILCPYHEMKKNRQWEGEVRVAGVPAKFVGEIKKAAEKMSEEAYRRDPMHRILDMKETKKELQIFTSQNQLARHIAKKIFASLKKHFSKPKIHKAKGADPVLITMEWQE